MNFVAWLTGENRQILNFDGVEKGCHPAFNECNDVTFPQQIRDIIKESAFLKELGMCLVEDLSSSLLNKTKTRIFYDDRMKKLYE